MSTKRGGAPKGPPKHQNKRAYKPFQGVKKNPNEPGGSDGKTFAPIAGVCLRCKEQLEWRRKYGKYKPLTEPTKCIWCQKRNVRSAYHAICSACASAKGACGKCCKQVNHIVGKSAEQEEAERRQLQEALTGMRERDRRTLLRAMERGSAKLDKGSAGVEGIGGDLDADPDDLEAESGDDDGAAVSQSASSRAGSESRVGDEDERKQQGVADGEDPDDPSDSASEWESGDEAEDDAVGHDDDEASARGDGTAHSRGEGSKPLQDHREVQRLAEKLKSSHVGDEDRKSSRVDSVGGA